MASSTAQSVSRSAGGFTLVEILIVVMILGILAAVVLPALAFKSRDAEHTAFHANLRQYTAAYLLYLERHGQWPADGLPGVMPAGMAAYIDSGVWANARPLGGMWDWDYQQFGYTAGISVYGPARTDTQMIEVDQILDDGDLNTGNFRRRNGGFIYIIEH